MANRTFRASVYSLTPNLIILLGKIVGTGTGTDPELEFKGASSATWTATGKYRVVLEDKYVELRSAQLTFCSDGYGGYIVQVGDYDVTTVPSFVDIEVRDAAGTLVDLDVGTEVHIALHLRNSTVTE